MIGLSRAQVKDVIVVRRTGGDVPMTQGRDAYFGDLKQGVADTCAPEPMIAPLPIVG